MKVIILGLNSYNADALAKFTEEDFVKRFPKQANDLEQLKPYLKKVKPKKDEKID